MNFSEQYLKESQIILSHLDCNEIEKLVSELSLLKTSKGRLFILGAGGSAGTASHAVNDFRKICNIETYSPVDNVSELTARTNDDGWDNCFVDWLKVSNLNDKDALLILSVGGGNLEKNVSPNLVKSIDFANSLNTHVLGIVGRDGGYTKLHSNACVLIPALSKDRITPHTEGICSVVLHLLVSHPSLKQTETKWESTK